jgi:hypothetical protein
VSNCARAIAAFTATRASYRGHNYPDRFKVWITGQVRHVTKAIRREMGRRAAVEPVIGHLKDDHRMRRNHLKGREGDRINAVLAAAGYNFSLLLRWFDELLRGLLLILARVVSASRALSFSSTSKNSANRWSGSTPIESMARHLAGARRRLGMLSTHPLAAVLWIR